MKHTLQGLLIVLIFILILPIICVIAAISILHRIGERWNE